MSDIEEFDEFAPPIWQQLTEIGLEAPSEALASVTSTPTETIARQAAEIERLREAMEFVLEVARWHFDGDADPKNESPEDMVAHINGLIVQRVREALGDER